VILIHSQSLLIFGIKGAGKDNLQFWHIIVYILQLLALLGGFMYLIQV